MTSTTFFIIFIPILSIILLFVNLLLAPHNPYQEKDSVFECGFHSFLGQNRTQFSISFFIFGLLFLLFDLEIILIYPYSVSGYNNDVYGLIIMMIFFVLLTLGFIFELGKNALTIDSKQTLSYVNIDAPIYYIESDESESTNIKTHEAENSGGKVSLFSNTKDLNKLLPGPILQSSSPDLTEIVTEINTLLPQLADFISRFHNVVNLHGINVITDAAHNMSIDVPSDIPEAQKNSINNQISILDRCIKTRAEQIADLIDKGRDISYKLRLASGSNSEFMRQIVELRTLNSSYLH